MTTQIYTVILGLIIWFTVGATNNNTSFVSEVNRHSQSKAEFTVLLQNKTTCRSTANVKKCLLQMTTGSKEPTNLMIFNNSKTITARNIRAKLPSNLSDINQNATNCTILLPQHSCNLSFLPGNIAHSPTTVAIVGNNASTSFITIEVIKASSLGGAILGLVGSVSLQNNSGDTLTQSTNGRFTFSTAIMKGSVYNVTVSSQPSTQTCKVSNGTGVMGNSDINNVRVTCSYNGIYTLTTNCHSAYSANNGASWGTLLNQQCGRGVTPASPIAVNSSGIIYLSTGGVDIQSIIYSSDGTTWTPISIPWPIGDIGDWTNSIFALNSTLYSGSGNGYLSYTLDNGVTWTTGASNPDNSSINGLFVNSNGKVYVGTNNGNIFYSSNNGAAWTKTQNKPDNSSIVDLAVNNKSIVYAVTTNSVSPLYSSNGITWTSMGALPGGNNKTISVYAINDTIYVGTDTGNILYTLNNGSTWVTLASKPDSSGVQYLVINQGSISPSFVETSGLVAVNNGQVTVTVKNLLSLPATGVHAELPENWVGVISTVGSNCHLVAPQGNCTLKFSSTIPYAPGSFNVVGTVGTNETQIISRLALVFSLNNYFVYYVDSAQNQAYVVDNNNAGSEGFWEPGSDVAIWGISENSTTTVPSPDGSQGATQYLGQQNCEGVNDGLCNTDNVLIYYNSYDMNSPIPFSDYAAGLCYQSITGGANQGDWYLPSGCELASGLYYTDSAPRTYINCTPLTTGVYSIFGLGFLPNLTSMSRYWTSTEDSYGADAFVFTQRYSPGGGGGYGGYGKLNSFYTRCVRRLVY